MSDFKIYIPTYKRAEYLLKSNRRHTLSWLSKDMLKKVWLIVRYEEGNEYRKVCDKYGCNMSLISLNHIEGIARTRDMILKDMYNDVCYHTHAFMMDDDLKIAYKPDAKTYITPTPERVDTMFEVLTSHVGVNYPIGGISARQFSNNKTEIFDYDTRIIQVFCFYVPVLMKEQVKFYTKNMPFMTDYKFVLTYLSKGYHNVVYNRFTRDDNVQTPGGCSEIRDTHNQSLSAKALHLAFPNHTRLVWKNNGTWKERRLNCSVQWKKAYGSKQTD